MSQENVEVVRRGYEAFRSGELDGVLSSAEPGIEIRPDPTGPLGRAGLAWPRGHSDVP